MLKSSEKKILIHAPNWVGDHIMAFPFYAALRDKYPQAKLILVGRRWITDLFPEKTFEKIIPLEGKKTPEGIDQHGFSLSFTLSPSFRSATLLWQSKAPTRVGYQTDFRSWLLSLPKKRGALRIPPLNENEHRALSYLRLLSPWLNNEELAEDLFAHFKNQSWQINQTQPPLAINKDVLIVCPGSVAPSKVYPMRHLAIVIAELLARKEFSECILVGSHIEKKYATELIHFLKNKMNLNKIIDLTAQTSLSQVATMIAQAKLVIANDSGIGHMTSLTHTPMVSFQGMGRKEETLPLNRNKRILHLHLPCSPCKEKECPRKDYPIECLDQISPEMVINAAQSLLL